MGVRPISDKPLQPSKKKTSSSKGHGKEFGDFLKQSDSSDDSKHLAELFESIDHAANDLAEKRGEDALKQYRKKVREFLQEVLSETRQVKVIIRDSIYDDPMVIIKIIDKHMDELAALVIREEVERSQLMKIIDEIKGILVDLYS